jgi:hypothetical protein
VLTTFSQTIRVSRIRRGFGLLCGIVLLAAAGEASAQQRHYPLDQNTPPGVYGAWSGWQQHHLPQQLQAVRVILPTEGTVIFYSSARQKPLVRATPAQAAIALGHTYRLEIQVPNPNRFDRENAEISLYPTIELVDVLHPPEGLEEEFPIPIAITEEEIALALEGRMVTKVVYLEPASAANPLTIHQRNPTHQVSARSNVIEEADLRGRPMLIFRMGGRKPARDEAPSFFGAGAPLSATVIPPSR